MSETFFSASQSLKRWLALAALAGPTVAAVGVPAKDGLYAEIETNFGTFTAELFYAEAPMTVAHFVGLATGETGWIDAETGLIRHDSYYAGVSFFRVIEGFLSEVGRRVGPAGTGPGYVIPDELNPLLIHDRPGVLSLVKAELPGTGGGAFKITAGPAPSLDGVNPVFGVVVDGFEVIEAINGVATTGPGGDPPDEPLSPVRIANVRIVAQGVEAEAFDPTQHQLPTISARTLFPFSDEATAFLVSRAAESSGWLVQSTDLQNFTVLEQNDVFEPSAPGLRFYFPEPLASDRGFFAFSEVDYPRAQLLPAEIVDRRFILELTSVGVTLEWLPQTAETGRLEEIEGGNAVRENALYGWERVSVYAARLEIFPLPEITALDLQLITAPGEPNLITGGFLVVENGEQIWVPVLGGFTIE